MVWRVVAAYGRGKEGLLGEGEVSGCTKSWAVAFCLGDGCGAGEL